MKKICSIIALILCAATLFAGIVPRLWPPLLKKAAKKGGAEPSWTPPQQDELVIASTFDSGILEFVFDDNAGTYYGPTNVIYNGDHESGKGPFFVWTDQNDHSLTDSGNVVGYRPNNTFEMKMPLKGSAPVQPAHALTNWTFAARYKFLDNVNADRILVAGASAGDSKIRLQRQTTACRFYLNGAYVNAPILSLDTWHHICITYDYSAGQGTLYHNGTSVAVNNQTYVLGNPHVYICTARQSSRIYYDDIYVWKTTLTPSEVESLADHY